MTNNAFIISTLNIKPERIKSLETKKADGRLQIFITLVPAYPECAYDGRNTKIKEYRTVPYNHLDFAGTPSTIIWKRTRYVCTHCDKTFSEPSPFGPDGFISPTLC